MNEKLFTELVESIEEVSIIMRKERILAIREGGFIVSDTEEFLDLSEKEIKQIDEIRERLNERRKDN